MVRQKETATLRRYTFTVHIPACYKARPSKAERVVWLLLSPVAVLLAGYCLAVLLGAAAAAGLWHLLVLFDGGGGLLFLMGLLLVLLAAMSLLAGLTLLCPLLAVKSRRDFLAVEGETIRFLGWPRRERSFTFSDIAYVQARQGRETVVLRDRDRRPLCRLNVTMEGLDVLLADLRSRRVLFAGKTGQIIGDPPPPLSPGPRKEEQTLDLPADVPGWYRLAYPGVLLAVFGALLAFSIGVAGLAFCDGARLESLCLTPFALLAVLGLVWVRMERIEIIGDHIRRRNVWGRMTDCRFEDIAAARIRTAVTGIGPLSSVELLDRTGKPLLTPGVGMTGTGLLLADLIRRGVPFTY